jgi:hypothetical protein
MKHCTQELAFCWNREMNEVREPLVEQTKLSIKMFVTFKINMRKIL